MPIDIPQTVEWGQTIAPAFQQRKVISMMDEVALLCAPPSTTATSQIASMAWPIMVVAQHGVARCGVASMAWWSV